MVILLTETAVANQNVEPQAVIEATPAKESKKVTAEEALEHLKEMQENVGQMSELAKEEENLVNEFFNLLVKILKPFCESLEISASSLPEKYSTQVSKAHLYLNGQLILSYKNGEVKILNLAQRENREILIEIAGDVLMQLEAIINSYRSKIEKRAKILMTMTKELQKVAKVFTEE